jgi:AcrR family transcriptional regulator
MTRALIAEAAQDLFTRNGYLGTSVRAIAAAAGVDAALVVRYFGSKEQLFLETVRLTGFIDDALPGPRESLGERIVAAVFDGDLRVRLSIHSGMLRASGSATVREKIGESSERHFVGPLERLLDGPDARLRARLMAAQVNGLLTALTMDESLDADRDALIRTYGRALQALVDG